MQQTCRNPWCSQPFEITPEDLAFYDQVSPIFAGKKELIPPPTLCPDCRQRQRLSFRNERRLFKRTCDLSKESIISMYPPATPFPVYSTASWWSDQWDAKTYGSDVDFSRSFIEQLQELYLAVPRLQNVGSSDMKAMNSEYVNFAGWNKNCYLIFDSDYNEDCSYSNVIKHSKTCNDCSYVSHSQLCCECTDCNNCYELSHCQRCNNCNSGTFLLQCTGCQHCAFCCNLANKSYCLWNEQLTKEEYHLQLNALLQPANRTLMEERWKAFTLRYPRKYCSILQSEECTGDYISQGQRCVSCFNVGEAQDLKYCDSVYRAKDCMDVSSFGEGIEQVSNSGTIGHGGFGIHFCYDCVTNCSNLFYCLQCHQSKNCFGCVGFRSGEYCILNKQYSKEGYEKLVPQIIEHMRQDGENGGAMNRTSEASSGSWGEFFPVAMSPFAYNETVAQEYFPLTQAEATKRGWTWREEKDEMPKVSKVIPAQKLPDTIADIPDDILNWAIECETTKRPFRIVKQELAFYRQMQLPIPHLHPDERHRRRMALRNPRKLWNRKCAKCQKPIATSYALERPEIVYCEECYLKEVY